MRFKLPKNLLPSTLTLSLICYSVSAQGAPGPTNMGENGPINPSNYPGISSEIRKGIIKMNMMFRATDEALRLAKSGNCADARATLVNAKQKLPTIDNQEALTTGTETDEVAMRLSSDFSIIQDGVRLRFRAIHATCQ